MKKLFSLLFLTLSFSLVGQSYDFLDPDLKRVTVNRGMRFNPAEIQAFLHTGEKVVNAELTDYLMNVDYVGVLYANDQREPKALVFEKATEKQKTQKIEAFEKYPGGDFKLKETLPNFSLADLEGNQVTLDELKGDYVLLNFWFVGCKPCIMEMPELNEIVEEFEPQGIHFLAIGLDNADRTEAFLEKQPFNYTLLPNGRMVAAALGIRSYPTHLLLDRKGKVIFSQEGYFPGLEYALKKRLRDASND